MLNWLFKKRRPADAPVAPPAPPPVRAAAPAAVPRATGPDETALLSAALGDDAALLKLAQTAQALATKMAAVEALSAESALRQAEREFRSHDRKVHRLAKQRLEAAVAQREARSCADALMQRTEALLGDAAVPVNHLVDIDREWAALPAPALAPAQVSAFTALRDQLDRQMRAHEAAQQWATETQRELTAWPATIAGLAAQGSADEVAQRRTVLAALQASRPDTPPTAALAAALGSAMQVATQVHDRLVAFEAPVAAEAANVDVTATEPESDTAAATAPAEPVDADAPAPADVQPLPPLPPELARLLDARDAARQAAAAPEIPADHTATARSAERDAARVARAAQDESRRAAQLQRLGGLVDQAEAALSEGRLAELKQQLQAIDHSLSKAHAALPEVLRDRVHALQAERGRLQAWQQWGGARARDDLLTEAEALALATGATLPPAAAPVAAEPQVSSPPEDVGAPAAPNDAVTPNETPAAVEPVPATAPEAIAEPAASVAPIAPVAATAIKLNLKAHGESIQNLRKRWKALDHQGAVASAEQWRRFDAALHLAYQPVAAQQAVLKAARLENLAAREALLTALEAGAAATSGEAGEARDWRARITELDRFQTAWRKLGPVEHTVPTAAREALMQRLQATLAIAEAPLQQARAEAAAEREQLIAHAEGLLPRDGDGRPAPDAARHVRELQAAWQDNARRLPLPRGLEGALWARFKAATDAVFAQREAAFAARDAEAHAHLAEREALLQQLLALNADSAPSDIEHTVAAVDRAWRQGGELPRGAAEALEARFRAARATATGWLGAAHRHRWQAHCDALAARVVLCERREDGGADAATLDARWAESDSLPAAWRQTLVQRWAAAQAAGPLDAAALDTLLLRLENALAVPSAPEWQAARQQLKLLALKDTMEGRTPVATGPREQALWLQAVVRQAGLQPTQRQRLHAVLAALRQAPPGALGTVDDAD